MNWFITVTQHKCVCEEPQAALPPAWSAKGRAESSYPLPQPPCPPSEHRAQARLCGAGGGPSKVGCRGLQEQTQVVLGLDCLDVEVASERVPCPPPLLWGAQGWLEGGSPSNSRAPDPTSLGEREWSLRAAGCGSWAPGAQTQGSMWGVKSSKVRAAVLRMFQLPPRPPPKPSVSTLTPWATANSKFPKLIIDEDEEPKGHGDQPPLVPEDPGEMTR